MPSLFDSVQPGDVISSDVFNDLIEKLEEIDQRVQTLETDAGSAGAVVITGFNPPLEVAAGQLLEAQGANFAFPPEDNSVTVGNEPATEFLDGSTSTLLRFIVPTGLDVPAGGANFTIRVVNENGTIERLYRILPEVPVVGDPPQIDGFENTNGSGPPVAMGQFLVIRGANFAEDPTQNQITLSVNPGSGAVTYPAEGEGPLEINADSSDSAQIHVRVPDIAEIPGQFNAQPVVVELVVGAHPPVTDSVNIWRLPVL